MHQAVCRGRSRVAALAVVVALGLSACNGGDEPDGEATGVGTLPTGSTSGTATGTATSGGTGTPTTSATVAPVGLPPEAKEKTAEGAEAFARYYVKVGAESLKSGDSANLRAMLGACQTCLDVADLIDSRTARGEHYEAVTQEIGPSQVLETSDTDYVVGVLVDYKTNFIIDANQKRIAQVKAERASLEVSVSWTQGWKVDRVVRQ